MKGQYLELVKKFREQRDKWLEKALEKAQKRIEQLIEDARQDRLLQHKSPRPQSRAFLKS